MMDEVAVFEPMRRQCVRRGRLPDGEVTPLNRMLPGSRDLGRFLQWVLEVLDGRRSVVQLAERLAPGLARRLREQAGGAQRRSLLAHHLRVIGTDVLEFWGTVTAGCGRVQAMAGRVEVHGLGWWCTAFDLLVAETP